MKTVHKETKQTFRPCLGSVWSLSELGLVSVFVERAISKVYSRYIEDASIFTEAISNFTIYY